jgi:hypothetical protein
LGERRNRTAEVRGSNPLGSTNKFGARIFNFFAPVSAHPYFGAAKAIWGADSLKCGPELAREHRRQLPPPEAGLVFDEAVPLILHD